MQLSRLERVSEGFRKRLEAAKETGFKFFTDDTGRPVGTVRLTPAEQLQRFMQLRPEHIAQYRLQYGDEAVEKFFQEMMKLGAAKWPSGNVSLLESPPATISGTS